MHTKKTRTTITINKTLLEKAKKYDISISSFLDIKLREYLSLLEVNIDEKLQLNDGQEIFWLRFFLKKAVWTERDLNPRPLPCEGSDLPV